MTTEQLLNSPTIIAAVALFIGMIANAIAYYSSKRAESAALLQAQQHKENLHIAIAKLTNTELLNFDELQNIDT